MDFGVTEFELSVVLRLKKREKPKEMNVSSRKFEISELEITEFSSKSIILPATQIT